MATTTTLHVPATGWDYTALAGGPVGGPDGATLVLLLHGFPQNRFIWADQVDALAAAGYRAVAPDQRGYSPGARPDPADLSSYAIEHLVDDVLSLADAAGAPDAPFHLVGHDWGGAVAWMAAARPPNRVRNPAVLSRPHPYAFRRALESDADGQQHRSRHHRAFLEPQTAALLLEDGAHRLRAAMEHQGVPPANVDRYVQTLGTLPALESALAWYRAAAAGSRALGVPADAPAALGRLPVPTLYIWGDADATVGPSAARATAEHVAGPYRFEVIAGAGHFLTDQVPAQISRLLLEHLTEHR